MRTDISKLSFIIVLFITLFTTQSSAINNSNLDYIILTDGEEMYGKVGKVSKTEVQFTTFSQKGIFFSKGTDTTLDPTKIYLIKYKDRGNVYFLSDGSRKSEESKKIEKGANLIYLIKGAEIPGWDIEFQSDKIKFKTSKGKKKERPKESSIPLEDIFMIKYADGSVDLINNLEQIRDREEEENQKAESIKAEPKIKVIFYTVKTGDTLVSIAQEYEVGIDQIREWNELDAKIKDTSRLKSGLQLMIQKEIYE